MTDISAAVIEAPSRALNLQAVHNLIGSLQLAYPQQYKKAYSSPQLEHRFRHLVHQALRPFSPEAIRRAIVSMIRELKLFPEIHLMVEYCTQYQPPAIAETRLSQPERVAAMAKLKRETGILL